MNTPEAFGVHEIAVCKKRVTRVHFVASLYVENTVTHLTLLYGITALTLQGIKGKKKLILWLPASFKMFTLVKVETRILTLFILCIANKLPIHTITATSHLNNTTAHDTAT